MRKISKVVVALVCIIAVMGVVLAQVVYTLAISNTMRLGLNANLELKDSAGGVVTSYAWGDFTHSEMKRMCASVGDGSMYLLNNGNGAVNVQWNSTVPVGWLLWITVDGASWANSTSKALAVGGTLVMDINMKELTAVGGQQYNFNLNFNVVS